MPYVSYERIIDELDINKGDNLFVSSDITNLMLSCHMNNETFDGNSFIQSITDKLGSEGTLVFPTFNWGFCKGVCFDYHKTKSKVGVLTNIALKHHGFKRTKHPIYSFAVWGRLQTAFCNLNNISSFGTDSPFSYFYDNYFKNLFIDIYYAYSTTFTHHCEEKVGVSYRFLKSFTADYVDESGVKNERTYSMYVRRLDLNVENQARPGHDIHDAYLRNNAVQDFIVNDILFRVLDMRKAYKLVEFDIKNNKSRSIATYDGQDD